MGVPISEDGYTSSTAGRGDHEVHKGHVVALGKHLPPLFLLHHKTIQKTFTHSYQWDCDMQSKCAICVSCLQTIRARNYIFIICCYNKKIPPQKSVLNFAAEFRSLLLHTGMFLGLILKPEGWNPLTAQSFLYFQKSLKRMSWLRLVITHIGFFAHQLGASYTVTVSYIMCNIKNTSSNNPFKINNKKWTALSVGYVIELFENAYYCLLVNKCTAYYTT
jgi:hypothetical protein